MKTLTKEQVYVVIDNQSDCDRAIEILTKAGEKQWSDKCAFNFDEVDRYLYVYDDGDWLIDRYIGDRTRVTLDELESLLKPKIKKSELLNRIEVLEKKVAELECKGTIEVEAKKPQFEVGKVYKDDLAMFYCTRIKYGKPYGFGFDYSGSWEEEVCCYWFTPNITEATPEEWFKRLEEEAKKRGFVKGVRFNSPNALFDFSFNQQIIEENFKWYSGGRTLGCSTDKNPERGNIMQGGKWAEIIEEPQYKIGTIGIFWDGDFEEAMKKGWVIFGELDHITEKGHFRRKGASWSWYNFKPIKID